MTKDYYSDYGHAFVKIFKDADLPEFVKEAEMLDEATLKNLPDSAFADSEARKLPIASAADTYISTAYHTFHGGKEGKIAQALDKAALFWGISDEVEKIRDLIKRSQQTKEASARWSFSIECPKSNYSISASGSDPESLALAYEEFSKVSADLEFNERVAVAKAIASEFDKLGMEIPFELGATSERNIPRTDVVCQEIKSRALRIPNDSSRLELLKMADALESATDKNLEGMSKIAECLDAIDRQFGLRRFYGTHFSDPHCSVFNTTLQDAQKEASVLELPSGNYSIKDIEDIDERIFKLALSESEYQDYQKDKKSIFFISEDSKQKLEKYL